MAPGAIYSNHYRLPVHGSHSVMRIFMLIYHDVYYDIVFT